MRVNLEFSIRYLVSAFVTALVVSLMGSLMAWAATPVAPPPETATTLTTTVARAGNVVLTSREVVMAGVIDRWTLTRGPKKVPPTADWVVSFGTDNFKTMLAQLLTEAVVTLEADSFGIAQVSADEVKKYSVPFLEDIRGWSEWKKLEATQAEVENLIVRHLRAKAFLKFRTESEGIKITDAEVKTFYERNRVKFGSLPEAQMQESIREYILRQRQEEKLKDWFESLRRKYHVRYLQTSVK